MGAHSFVDTVLRRDVTVSDRDMDDRDAVTLDAIERATRDFELLMETLSDRLHRKPREYMRTVHNYLSDLAGDTFKPLLEELADRDRERAQNEEERFERQHSVAWRNGR